MTWDLIKKILIVAIPLCFAVYVWLDHQGIKEIVIKWKVK